MLIGSSKSRWRVGLKWLFAHSPAIATLAEIGNLYGYGSEATTTHGLAGGDNPAKPNCNYLEIVR
jgi:hypothetical protein